MIKNKDNLILEIEQTIRGNNKRTYRFKIKEILRTIKDEKINLLNYGFNDRQIKRDIISVLRLEEIESKKEMLFGEIILYKNKKVYVSQQSIYHWSSIEDIEIKLIKKS